MAALSQEDFDARAAKLVEQIGPTLELEDLVVVVPAIMEIVELVENMTKEEKHQTALALLRYVLEHTDTPWLPDGVTDPLFEKVADLVLIPVIAKASKGGFAINL